MPSTMTQKESQDIPTSHPNIPEKNLEELPKTPPLLSLPTELLDQILHPLLLLPPNPQTPPSQPPITFLTIYLRRVLLPKFYAQPIPLHLSTLPLLSLAKSWLRALGPANVRLLRRIVMSGWRGVPFGHMLRRVRVVVVVDLRGGRVVEEEGIGELEGDAGEILRRRVEEGRGREWSVEGLGEVLEEFWSGCVGSC